MQITILTLFPSMFTNVFSTSIIKRAQEKNIVHISFVDMREFATDKHKSVDNHPYGGGAGMILRVDIVDKALAYAKTLVPSGTTHTVLLDPQGTPYVQKKAVELKAYDHLILICGHYEGVDERVRTLIDEEISIGDYVLTGGEIPAMVLVDSVIRLLPGVLKKENVTTDESFSGETKLLEYPHYTTPQIYKGMSVPDILLSGNHKHIASWRNEKSLEKTKKVRADLLTD